MNWFSSDIDKCVHFIHYGPSRLRWRNSNCRITMLKCTFTIQWFCRNISNTRQSLQECITTRMHTHSYTWKLQSRLYLCGRVDRGPSLPGGVSPPHWDDLDYMPLSEHLIHSVEKWRVGRGSYTKLMMVAINWHQYLTCWRIQSFWAYLLQS